MNDNDSEMLGLLAELSAAAAPSDLAGEVVHAATAARPVGQPITALGGGVAADPRAAFVETAGELAVVLADATSAMIVEPYGWNATQLVAHLLEVDLYFGRQLGLWDHAIDESMEHDHLRMTEAAVRASMRADLADTIAKWTDVSCAVCEHVLALDADALATRIKFHMLDTRTSTALVVRIFEMWTHTEDLCRTLRRQPPVLDAGRLALMTRAAVRAIPLGLLLGRIEADPQTV
ncbi:MAG TPA: maleylpyruvate isomerase N-terminal domain-containing protein, partial [Ilumatobacteraceae bacterium]